MTLTNQVVLITGCSSGIGRALALELFGRGQRVVATARKLASLSELEGRGIDTLRLDVTDAESLEGAVKRTIERAGRIDILINNAGFNPIGPLAEVPLADARRLFETNVLGPLALIQAVFPYMAQQQRGRIVNVGSVVGTLATPFAGVYCASKAAVHTLSEVLRMEVSAFGIDVIEVAPGAVRSSISDTADAGLERYRSEGSRYRPVIRGIERRARASQYKPMDTEAFARQVADAILADTPPRIVRAGRGAKLYPVLSHLPGAARDRWLKRQFGLLGWKAQASGERPNR